MDKNTIIGFILIAAVVIGFSILNRPSEEQIAQQKHINDSIQQERIKQAEYQEKLEDSIQNAKSSDGNDANIDNVSSFFQSGSQTRTLTSDSESIDSTSVAASNDNINEQVLSLKNELIKIDFSTKGAKMVAAELINYQNFKREPLYLFNESSDFSLELENKSSVRLYTHDAYFTPVQSGDSSMITFRLNYSDNQYLDFIYTLEPNSYMLKFDIMAVGMENILSKSSREKFILHWQQDLQRKEKSIDNEQRFSRIHYKNTGLTVEGLSESKDEKIEITDPVKWVAFKNQFFSSVLIADKSFDISVLSSKVLESQTSLKFFKSELYITPTPIGNDGSLHTGFRFFLGPLQYSMLKDFDDGISDNNARLDLDRLIPLGWALFRWINQYFVIPLFDLLRTTNLSMGIIILLLTIIVKLIISPLTYKSFMSSAKMRVLRPQVEEINAKFPKQEQAMDKQRATMELYRQAGVNPMSGCIPMLLQMPILIALFSFFPSAIELRHESFLWANDLSTYDAIWEWDAHIPLLSSWLGNHISLFCLLMTATNIVYTKFNMDAANTGQQQMPGMKWMMYLMPLIFLFVLNNYPSGLTYYYFLSTLITILLTLSFRFFVNEDALLAKLEENKKKPKKKKSGFMARLEEAQKLQQQQAREKAKANSKKRR